MDGTENQKNTSLVGDTSGGDKGTSTEPKTYTEEEVKARETKAASDALSAAGRDAKSISDKTEKAEKLVLDAQKLVGEANEKQKKRDEAERESLKDDSEALKSFDERQRQKDERAKLANEKTELDGERAKHQESVTSDLEQIKVFKRTQLAAEVSVAKGVSVDIILKHAKDDSREAMEAVADDFKEVKSPLKTDTSTTLGGGASWEEVRAAYIKNPNNQAVYERYMEMRKERERNR